MDDEPKDLESDQSVQGWPVGWEGHRRDQIAFIARNTTPAQRFKWLTDMLELLGPQMPQLLKNRDLLRKRDLIG